jgi:Leucine-rich repeat (LRR) protein
MKKLCPGVEDEALINPIGNARMAVALLTLTGMLFTIGCSGPTAPSAASSPTNQPAAQRLALAVGGEPAAEEPATEHENRRLALPSTGLQPTDICCANNLHQIGLALHQYQDAYEQLPTVANFDKNDKPLLSWRVFLLPFLHQNDLYRQFHINEPWNSAHNKKLIPRMPDVYRCPNQRRLEPGITAYVAPVGPRRGPYATLFSGNNEIRSLNRVPDGIANTILLLEVDDDHAVTWTKPEDLKYDPEHSPMTGSVGRHTGLIPVLFADGAWRFLESTIDKRQLRALFTFNAGDIVSLHSIPGIDMRGEARMLRPPQVILEKESPPWGVLDSRADVWLDVIDPVTKQTAHVCFLPMATDASDLEKLANVSFEFCLHLDHSAVTDRGLKRLKDLKNLRGLSLFDTKVTISGLGELRNLKNLAELDLHWNMMLTGAGLHEFPGLTRLDLGYTFAGAGLVELKDLKKLTWLNLSNTRLTDAGLKCLKDLTSLTTLDLSGNNVTGVGLRELRDLKNLTTVNCWCRDNDMLREAHALGLLHKLTIASGQCGRLHRLAIPDDIRPRTPEDVKSVDLGSTWVTDEGLKELKDFKNLMELGLDGWPQRDPNKPFIPRKVTDAGLKELAAFKKLTTLSLRRTQVTDAGLKELAEFKALSTLYLRQTQVTDVGLKELAGLKNLAELDLADTKVTSAGVRELQKHLPGLVIIPEY